MKENTGKSKYVMLGMLARMPQTGYTIKKMDRERIQPFLAGELWSDLSDSQENGG